MLHDILVRVKEIGEVTGSFAKNTQNSIYIKNAYLNKSQSACVSMFKIDKKFVVSVSRIGTPPFETFTNHQLQDIITWKNEEYSKQARIIITRRISEQMSGKKSETSEKLDEVQKESNRSKKSKKGWNQLQANEKLFDVIPEFDISEYSTVIDRNAKNYKEIYERSVEVAKEINEQKTTDAHRLEERGIMQGNGENDGKLYSDVSGNVWTKNKEIKIEEPKQETNPLVLERMQILKTLEELKNEIKSYQERGVDNDMNNIISVLSRRKSYQKRLEVIDKALEDDPNCVEIPSESFNDKKSESPALNIDAHSNENKKDKTKSGNNRQNRIDKKINNGKNISANKPRHIKGVDDMKSMTIKNFVDLINSHFINNRNSNNGVSWNKMDETSESVELHLKPTGVMLPIERIDIIKNNLHKSFIKSAR